jgi:hypothetical protein
MKTRGKLATLPGVHVLSRTLRYVDGGRKTFLEFVQLAVHENVPAAQEFMTVFMELNPYERSKVSLDDVCAAAGVQPSDLMGQIVSVAVEYGRDMGNFVAAAMHPKVVSKHIESALDINGLNPEISLKDRMAFLQAQNFLPAPKSSLAQINVNASANSQAAAASSTERSVPSFADDMREVSQVPPPRRIEPDEPIEALFESEEAS